MTASREPGGRGYLSLALFAALLIVSTAGLVLAAVAGTAATLALLTARALLLRRRSRRLAAVPGVTLGVQASGRPARLSDRQLAAHALIVGASGAGKSTTLLAILDAQIRAGRPVVAIDMKGSTGFADELRLSAAAAGRRLLVWTPDGPCHWNPLAHGNATALKDKLISTERFTEPHYQRAAERYVQAVLQVLHAAHPGRPARLDQVVAMMEPVRLRGLLGRAGVELAARVQDYLASLTPDQVSAIRGLGTRLALLAESNAGPFLAPAGPGGGPEVDLAAALDGGDVVLLSLNASIYGKLAAQLGALAIQDLISAVGHRLGDPASAMAGGSPPPATIVLDEFSALGSDHVLALLARGREAGVSLLLATQELSDLERAGAGFRDQVLGVTAVKIAHRQDVPASARTIALMAGTERVWERTERIPGPFDTHGSGGGTRRQVERFVVDPNEIMRLRTGEAVLIVKTPSAGVARVSVTPTVRAGVSAQRGIARVGARGAGRDQPDPGVTR